MSRKAPEPLEEVHATDRAAWRAWLAANHTRTAGVWLVYHKVTSATPSVRYDEAVEECLCFGWIDSKVESLDAERYRQLITPRKKKSVWSAVNKRKIERLIESGLMTPAGLAKIEEAKRDGSWEALDAVEALTIPDDLAEALAGDAAAAENFAKFNRTSKRNILMWIASAKKPETRRNRIAETAALAAKNVKARQ